MRGAFQLALGIGLAATGFGCGRSPVSSPPETVRLGLALETPCVLPIVALERHFFADEGLTVNVTDYVSGARALSGMLTGEVDVATVAEVPIVANSFDRQDFAVFASIAAVGNQHNIVARKDAGIVAPGDLRGKRLATQRASSIHFFLHLFLLRHQLSDDDVTLSFRKIEELAPALARGEADAISAREPYTSEARSLLGTNAVVFEAPGIYFRTQHVVAGKNFLRTRPEAARRLARGLLQAERFVQEHPDEARSLVAQRLKIPATMLAHEWSHFHLKVSLEQSLLPQLEDEAMWMLNTHLVPAGPIPNYLELLDSSMLRTVRPDAVTVVR